LSPPAASCLTARRRLQAEPRLTALSRGEGGAQELFRLPFTLRRSNPLTPLEADEEGARERSFSLGRARFRGQHVNAAAFTIPRCLPPWKSRTSALAGTRSGALLPLADGGRRCTFSSRFREPRLDPSPRRFRGRFMAACASTTSADRCFNEHDRGPLEHPCRDKQQGWPPLSIDRRLSIDGYRRRSSRSGVEDHRASTFPPGIAPGKDFAPTPIASDTSCRGHCLSPCLESTRVTDEAAGAASASKARVAGG
jgi:hypothetical protein